MRRAAAPDHPPFVLARRNLRIARVGILSALAGLGFIALALPGCAGLKKTPIYEGPFDTGSQYVADAPLSAYLDDVPFEHGGAPGTPIPSPVRSLRDPVVLLPGTRLEFTRKDSPYLVFLVKSGENEGRYAWIQQHGEDIERVSPIAK